MARIPEETLQQVLMATDIVDVVGRVVKLRRTGTNWLGLCPFHNEKTPSFNVRPSTHSYHCFGCGAGGNAFRFLMENEGLTFMEAVKRLADAAGIRIEEEVWDANAEAEAKKRALLMSIHKNITLWYHELLLKSPLAEAARDYLKGRGINSDVAKRWQLGYAPAGSQPLRAWAASHQYGRQALLDAGILKTHPEKPDAYPTFRDRLMFPIRNDHGEVIAFSGRLLEANPKVAKYLNSPETAIFSKSKVLFAFDRAKRAISKASQAIVCEGQIDALMLHEAGFTQSVAGQGTAFTEFHAKSLRRHADEVILCYDSDAAGIKAADKTFKILAPTGLIVKVAALPKGEDPDSMLRKQGVEAFQALLQGAQEFLDYQISSTTRDLSQTRERVRFAQELAENMALMQSPIARETAVQRAAVRLGLPEETLRQLVTRELDGPGSRSKKAANAEAGKEERPGAKLLAEQDKNALLLTRLALADAQVLAWLRAQPHEQILQQVSGTELLGLIWKEQFDPLDPVAVNVFLTTLPEDEHSALNQLLHESRAMGGLPAAEHALRALELTRLQQLMQRLQTQLKQPNLSAEDSADLQREVMSIHQEIATWRQLLKPTADLG